MAKKNFLLLSLDDDKTKAIANTVSNPTCKKILDFLSDSDGTETEISEKLNVPISTVHYNLKQLVDGRLVEIESSTFSEKGKQIKHYTLANKYIIIAPKGGDKQSFLDAVKNILPVFGLGLLGTFFVSKFSSFGPGVSNFENLGMAPMIAKSAGVAPESALMDERMMYDEVAPRSVEISVTMWDMMLDMILSFQPWEWFLFGFTFAIFCIWLSCLIKKKFKKKKILI
jgi:DNA-binding transcriptional ArsR family regulator